MFKFQSKAFTTTTTLFMITVLSMQFLYAQDATNPPQAEAPKTTTTQEENPKPTEVVEPSKPKDEISELKEEFQKSAASYIEEADQYREISQRLLKRMVSKAEKTIESKYDQSLGNYRKIERERRLISIEKFKAFLNDNKPHPQYTPDAIFRLAMLLLEEGDERYVEEMQTFNEKLEESKGESTDLIPPQKDHTQVIQLFSKLIQDWPDYRDLDGAYYSRGHCFLEMNEEQEAMRDFYHLVNTYGKSDYFTETWNVLGELNFDFNQLDKAVEAYKYVIQNKESHLYMPALYKLAWTYYKRDQYQLAIEHFKQLIEFSDEQVKQGKEAFALRTETLQYLAISLQEDDWDGDGMADIDAGFQRVKKNLSGKASYEAELVESLMDIFFETAKYEDAIASAEYLFTTLPFYPRNPIIHHKIVTAYERIAQPQKAFQERDRLTNLYVKDGPWYAFNHTDQKAIDSAKNIMKDSLLQAGNFHHSEAQLLRKQSQNAPNTSEAQRLMEQAKDRYRKASLAYERYLSRFKKDQNTYELLFLYAEALFFGQDYEKAVKQFLTVRDSKISKEYEEPAAFYSILAHLELVKLAINQGKIAPKPSLLDQERPEEKKEEKKEEGENKATQAVEIKPEEIPPIVMENLAVRLQYLDRKLSSAEDPQRVPVLMYKVGEIYMDYLHFDQARPWFERLIKEYAKEEITQNAASLLIESYRVEQNWAMMAQWADLIAQSGLGGEAGEQAKLWKVGALFKSAQKLFDEGKFEDAAREYVALVDKNPTNEFAAAALNNAAVAFEKSRFFDSAMKTFERIFAEYPQSEFTENALFRVAYNAERFYDYDKAIQRFQDLARNYPKGENATSATYNAARLLEQTQKYNQAAIAFIDFANQFPEHKEAAKSYFRAAKNYERMGDWKNQIKIYEGFKSRYGKESENSKLIIEGLAKTIEIYKKQGDKKKVNALYAEMIKEFDLRSLPAGSYEANYPAEAMFQLIEPRFERFSAMKIKGSMKQQGQIIVDMKKEIAGLTDDYSKLLKYKSLGWNIAAFYRIGLLRQLFAQALYELPIPENLTDEMRDIYTTQIEDLAIPIEDEAVKRFEEAYDKAKEFRISNEWTQKILLSLNKYKPAEYPTFKTEKRMEFKQFVTNSYIALPKDALKIEVPEPDPSQAGEKKAKTLQPDQNTPPQDQQPKQPSNDGNTPKPTNTNPEQKSDSVEDVTL